MGTPTSGPISIGDLRDLYSPLRTAPGSLDDYRVGNVLAPGEKYGYGTSSDPFVTSSIPSTPGTTISLDELHNIQATVHPAPTITATTSENTFFGFDVSWTESTNGETADSWEIGYRPAPAGGAYTYVSTDENGTPITSSPITLKIPNATTPQGLLHEFVIRGINGVGTGTPSETSSTAYKKAGVIDMAFDTPSAPLGSTVGSLAGEGVSTVQIWAAVGAGGSTGPYLYTGGDGPVGAESPFSLDSGFWWWPHYTYQTDMAGAGGGGAGAYGYYPVSIPVTPATPISVTVGAASGDGSGGTTSVNIGGTNYVVAGGGLQGFRGGMLEGNADAANGGMPYAVGFIPSTPYTNAQDGPAQQLSFLQKGYRRLGWDTQPELNSPAPTESPYAMSITDRTMTALFLGKAGDGGNAGSVSTGTNARSPLHTNGGDGYAGVNMKHNRPTSDWPGQFGRMHGAGGLGYTMTFPNTMTIVGLPGYVPLNGPAYPGSGSLTVNKGSGGNWKAPAFPSSYGKIYTTTGAQAPVSFPGHAGFSNTPAPVMSTPSNADQAQPGFAYLRFNSNVPSISAYSYTPSAPPAFPTQHTANGRSVPSSGNVYFNRMLSYPPIGPYSGEPGFFYPNHSAGPNKAYGGSIGGGGINEPTNTSLRKVTYFPLNSGSGVAVDPGTLTSSHTFTNHAVIISPDTTNKSYSAGGYGHYNPPTNEGQTTDIASFAFPSTSISSSVDTLTTGRAMHGGFSLGVSNRGYIAGGWTGDITGSKTAVSTMEQFVFPSETNAAESSTLTTSRMEQASGASMDYGYQIAGASKYPADPGNTNYSDIDRFAGASGSSSITRTDLGTFPESGRMVAWSNLGYVITSTPRMTGFSTIPLASGNRTAGYGEHRDQWFGHLRYATGPSTPYVTTQSSLGTAVSGAYDAYLMTDSTGTNRIERFPFASGYYAVDSVFELSPTGPQSLGYGSPGVG